MDRHEELMHTNEEYRRLYQDYERLRSEYDTAFEKKVPNKDYLEQELIAMGNRVAQYWEQTSEL